MKQVNIALIGFGTVGTGVVHGLSANMQHIINTTDMNIRIKTIADIDLNTDRGIDISGITITENYRDIAEDGEIDIAVQLIGGIDTAFTVMTDLLKSGKKVVTANKALLAHKGAELFRTAAEHGSSIAFEASTGGGIPIISALRDGLTANINQSVYGIVNGTSNYILSRMTEQDCPFDKALHDAQEKGYAEEDPSLDLDGSDAAHKLLILTAVGFRTAVSMDDIYVEGITEIKQEDISVARELGYTVKSLAIAIRRENGLELRVHPTLLSDSHPLSSVSGVFNAICVKGNLVGETMFYGKGAGSHPTASAVIADVIETASGAYASKFRNLCYFRENGFPSIIPFSETLSKFYLRIRVKDVPGVLADITSILSKNTISVASMIQKESAGNETAIEFMTHECCEADFQNAVKEIKERNFVLANPAFIRALDVGFESISSVPGQD